jgi:hypothetical protein
MLGWTLEDFLRVWQAQAEVRPSHQEPQYSVQTIDAAGRMEGDDFLRLDVRVGIRLQTAGRTPIPLAFPNGILTEYKVSPVNDEAFVHFDENLAKHVLWVSGKSGETCQVAMTLLVPVTHRGNQTPPAN